MNKGMMQSDAFNGTGWISTFLAVWFNLVSWLTEVHFNQCLAVLISILSIVFLFMKIYDQFLITKKRRKNDND